MDKIFNALKKCTGRCFLAEQCPSAPSLNKLTPSMAGMLLCLWGTREG